MQPFNTSGASNGAIIHEWIEPAGGAERVLDAFVGAYPEADVYALWNDAPARLGRPVKESWLASTPLRRHKAAAVPVMAGAWRNMRASREYDWALVSSHLFAHHATFRGQKAVRKHVYVHTPARYIWTPELDARGDTALARVASRVLRPLDRRRASEASSIAANSQFVRERVQRYWDQDALVIHPPVDVDRIAARSDWATALSESELEVLNGLPSQFVLGASRFIHYKRLDLVLSAAERAGLPVVIAGNGPLRAQLEGQAAAMTVPSRVIAAPSDAMLFALYQRALCYVFPAIEDFGIMPVEAMAAGCPVVTLNFGGAAETVEDGISGVHADHQSAASIARAIGLTATIDRTVVARSTARFSTEEFTSKIKNWISADLSEATARA